MKISKNKSVDFLKNLANRLKEHDIMTYSAALSFYFLQASIPLMMVLVSVISTFLNGNEYIIYEFLDLFPKTTANIILEAIDIIIISSQSTAVTTFTIIFALWSATSGVHKLIRAINHAYGLSHQSKAIKQRLMSIVFTLILIIFIMFLLIFQIYGSQILGILDHKLLAGIKNIFNENFKYIVDLISSPVFTILSISIPLVIMSGALGVFYKYAPGQSENRPTYKQAFMGGLFVIFAIYIISFIYSFFANNFSNKSLIYGALAGILALFIWLLIVSSLLIIGAELIAAYREGYKSEYFDKSVDKGDDSPSTIDKAIDMIKEKIHEK